MNKQVLGQNLMRYRGLLGLSQESIARHLGVSREEISYYENAKREMPTNLITKFAELAGVYEIDLYEEDISKVSVNLSFAFRAENLEEDDLKNIASFKKIVFNYLKLKSLSINE